MNKNKPLSTIDLVVIFDMDGVIINSEPLHQECEREMFSEMDIFLTQEEHDRFLGVSGFYMWKQLIEKFDLNESVERLVEIQNTCFIKKLENLKHLPIIEGVKSLIKELSEKQVLLILASSSSQRVIDKILTLSKLKKYFKHIISGYEIKKSKPAPDIFIKATEMAGVTPDKCIVIEDSENGVLAAKHAGMKVIGFLNGFNSKESLFYADKIVNDFSELSVLFRRDYLIFETG
ncbi:MAG: HAD family phosphatase [Bacteroidetes bacterium]|nr:HAD family phosphatase [Bacteroidota bacterium]